MTTTDLLSTLPMCNLDARHFRRAFFQHHEGQGPMARAKKTPMIEIDGVTINNKATAPVVPAIPTYSHARYAELLAVVFDRVRELGTVKGGEYAGDDDRLAHFRRNGAKMGVPMEIIWGVYFAKHEDAVMQYVQDLAKGKTRPRSEPISGRVLDMITYLILFLAILDEKGEAV